MPLRIAFDARHIGDFGIGTHIRNLIGALAHIDAENEYFLVCSREGERDLGNLPRNFRTATWRLTDRDWKDNFAFPAFLRRLRADVHHIPLNRVPLLMPRPYVVTMHDVGRLANPEQSRLWHQFYLWKSRRGMMRAERVIAVSTATQRDLETILGVPSARIRRIYDAPDPRYLEAADVDRTRRKGVLERYGVHYPYLLYAGNFRPQKNLPRLIEAFSVLRNELAEHPVFKQLRLIVIGGESSQNPAVRLAVNRTRMGGYIRFFGFVPQDTLQAFYESADAFVFPSLQEGFGLPPLEAMACGTPVVTSNVSSLPEVVGDAAKLVNPENVFEIARGAKEVLLDENLRRRLVELGRQQVTRFSWERTAQEVLATYRDAARSRL